MPNPKISVIIPTYNRKNLVSRAIESVFNQTFTDWELIIIDDASTDGTKDLAILKNNPEKITYITQEYQSGVSAARNRAAAQSQGEWLAFLDSDDEWLPKKLDRQWQWIESHPHYHVVQTQEIWIRRGVRVNPPKTHIKQDGDIFNISLERCMITPSSVILRKSIFNKTGGFNESLPACEDYDLWLKITSHYPVGLINEHLLIRYGGHEDQLSGSFMGLDRFRVRALLDLLRSGILNPSQQKLTAETCSMKAQIIAKGYKKRNRKEEYERYTKIAENCQNGK